MKITSSDELMLQRCLDNELSGEDTHRLLQRLDVLQDGWKTLACGFLSERSVAKAISLMPHEACAGNPESPTSSRPVRHTPAEHGEKLPSSSEGRFMAVQHPAAVRSARRYDWWSHPLTSLSLCGAIAFVAGWLLPDFQSEKKGTETASADGSVPSNTTPAQHRNPAAGIMASQSGPSEYSVRRLPDGSVLERPVRIPVTRSPQQYAEVLQQIPDLRRQLNEGTIRVIRVPADDQQDILFFVNEHPQNAPLQ
jgi:hypothetical protein